MQWSISLEFSPLEGRLMDTGDTGTPGSSSEQVLRPDIISRASVVGEFRRFMPVWFIYLSAIGLLHAALANFPDDGFAALGLTRMDFVSTIAFPMAWFVGVFALRIHRSTRLVNRWKAYVTLVFLSVGVPLLLTFFHRPNHLSHGALTTLFEWVQFFWIGVFVIHVIVTRGWQGFLMFFGVTFVYGLILENTGIVMRFFFEPSFRFYLGPLPAPLCTMFGWCLVFYVTVATVEKIATWIPWLAAHAWRRALVTTALALSVDAQLDPLASMSGVFWQWNQALPPVLLGVPVINYAAWFGAFLPFSYFVFSLQDREDLSPLQRNWELFLRVAWASLLGGLICFGLMAVVEGGFDGPSFQILQDFGNQLFPY